MYLPCIQLNISRMGQFRRCVPNIPGCQTGCVNVWCRISMLLTSRINLSCRIWKSCMTGQCWKSCEVASEPVDFVMQERYTDQYEKRAVSYTHLRAHETD